MAANLQKPAEGHFHLPLTKIDQNESLSFYIAGSLVLTKQIEFNSSAWQNLFLYI